MVKYTKQEEEALLAIEEKYKPELEACMKELNSLDISEQREEWLEASNRFNDVNERIQAEREVYFKQAELRAFEGFKGDVAGIVEAVKSQIPTFIYVSKIFAGEPPSAADRKALERREKEVQQAIISNEKLIEQFPNDEELKKNTQELKEMEITTLFDETYSPKGLKKRINESFKIYFEFLERTSPEALQELQTFIDKAIQNRDKISSKKMDLTDVSPEAVISTRYPSSFLSPTDKVSNLAFCNEITGNELQKLAMEKRGSKKQITTLASIDFDKLNGAVQIKARKELTAYDREVHDAIITLFVDGANEYITPQMIYQVMTGNPDAYLNPKQAEAISDSITKCMYSRLIIDAGEEAKAYGFDSFKYDGNLISGERVTATLNGNVLECLRILRPPVLYEYANKKNQIGRFDIKLLNTPINKTEEIITLQGYLYRRILTMKGSSNLSKTILYDTVYNQIDVTAASDGALRKKKSKVRDQVKRIFDYWKKEDFIIDYTENKKGQVIYSVTVKL